MVKFSSLRHKEAFLVRYIFFLSINAGYVLKVVRIQSSLLPLFLTRFYSSTPLIFFLRLCEIEWGINHSSNITMSPKTSKLLKSVFRLKWYHLHFWHFVLKRLGIMLQGNKICLKFCVLWLKASNKIWSRSEHVSPRG